MYENQYLMCSFEKFYTVKYAQSSWNDLTCFKEQDGGKEMASEGDETTGDLNKSVDTSYDTRSEIDGSNDDDRGKHSSMYQQ